MVIYLIILAIIVVNAACVALMLSKFFRSRAQDESLSPVQWIKLSLSGVIAFIADTLGVGSFAVNVALAKLLRTFHDDELPALNNGAQVIPGVIEAFFFIKMVDVDLTTLLVLILGTCIGGLLGGSVVSRLNKQAIRLAMICCFPVLIFVLIGHQLNIFPVGGDLVALQSWSLFAGFLGMILCGALTSVGIGLFVMVQAVLFLLNVSPSIAFPIMTAAGAMQQPLTTMVFLRQDKIPLKKMFILSLSGCLGVAITLPVFNILDSRSLHTLLLVILIYNLIAMGRAYLRARKVTRAPANIISASLGDASL